MSRNNTPYDPCVNSPPGVQPHIFVNNFCFCFHHGEEYCYRCPFDFRFLNNIQIGDDLDEIIAERLSDDRQSINVYSKGAEATYDQDYSWKCKKHDKINCEGCFNWIGDITKEIEDEIKTEKWLKKRQKYYEKRDD